MRKTIALCGFMLAAAFGLAGSKYYLPVTVGATYAWGSMGDARASADSRQMIGCYSTATATLRYAVCSAMEADGTYGTCRTYDADLIQVAESVGSDSTVEFNWSGTTCTSISVTNNSRYAPRLP